MPYALDGESPDPDVGKRQAEIDAELRRAGIDPARLRRLVKGLPDTARLALEYRAGCDYYRWHIVQPYYDELTKSYRGAFAALERAGLEGFPPAAQDHFCDFQEIISIPARRCARVANGPAAYRRDNPEMQMKAVHRRIAPVVPTKTGLARFLRAVRQRYMSKVRAGVYLHIAKRTVTPARGDRDGHIKACRLTARWICAYFPLFGAGTTTESVRKAIPRHRRQRKVTART